MDEWDMFYPNDGEDDEPCPGCENAPAKGYWRCPLCDAEWPDEEEDD